MTPGAAPSRHRIEISPSILAADFTRIGEQIREVEAGGCDRLHLDVMDGHFVPNLSMGPALIESVRKVTKLPLDTHLMITDPMRYAAAFAKAGSDSIRFHIEVAAEPFRVIDLLRGLDVKVGVVLNPATPASAVASIVKHVDLVLVMSVWPGFGGQKFMPEVLPRFGELRRLGFDGELEIDGGIDKETIGAAAAAGAHVMVAGTSVFRAKDPGAAVRDLRRIGEEHHAHA
ncbi:MAG: ribulose-phosphate 3-epimerase [Planctomycetes bacterium]|nr:ribulose-phosphate 3-epimerase [Planctomycetota bacterium]MBI3844492.1 ribulose-phosphate 3-epimerase [Planctomycetota bacterium]